MPRNKIPDIVEGRILQLLQEGYSKRHIVKILKLDGLNIAHSTAPNVNRKVGRQRNFEGKIQVYRKRPAQKSSIVKQVMGNVDVDDPPTQRAIVKSVNVNQSTVCRIIESVVREHAGFIVN